MTPIYEYQCSNNICGNIEEQFIRDIRIIPQEVICGKCGHTAKKIMSVPNVIIDSEEYNPGLGRTLTKKQAEIEAKKIGANPLC